MSTEEIFLNRKLEQWVKKNSKIGLRSVGNERIVSRIIEEEALVGLQSNNIISAFRLTVQNSDDDNKGVDCWVSLPLGEEEIPIQFKTGGSAANLHRKNHPDIPVVRTRRNCGISRSVEEVEKAIVEEIIAYRVNRILSSREIKGIRFFETGHVTPQTRFQITKEDKEFTFRFYFGKISNRKRSWSKIDERTLYVFMLGRNGWKSVQEVELEIVRKIGLEAKAEQ